MFAVTLDERRRVLCFEDPWVLVAWRSAMECEVQVLSSLEELIDAQADHHIAQLMAMAREIGERLQLTLEGRK